MKTLLMFFIFCLYSFSISFAQVNKDNLYDRYWHMQSDEVIKPSDTIIMYHRTDTDGLYDFSSIISLYNSDGTENGFDSNGRFSTGTWKFVSNNKIIFSNDSTAANIIKLTDKEFIVEVPQVYTYPLTGEKIPVVWRTVYSSFNPCAVYESLRSGDWNDPTLWSCQKIPTINNAVQINLSHDVAVPDNYIAYAKSMIQKGKLNFRLGSKLVLGKQ